MSNHITTIRFTVALDYDTYDKLKERAQRSCRSLSAEARVLITESLEKAPTRRVSAATDGAARRGGRS